MEVEEGPNSVFSWCSEVGTRQGNAVSVWRPLRRRNLQLKSSLVKAGKRPRQSRARTAMVPRHCPVRWPACPAPRPAQHSSARFSSRGRLRWPTPSTASGGRGPGLRAGHLAALRQRGVRMRGGVVTLAVTHSPRRLGPAAATEPAAGLLRPAAVPAPSAPPRPSAVTGGPAPQVLGILGAMFSGKENVHCASPVFTRAAKEGMLV